METLQKYWSAKVLLALFLFFTLWWVYMILFLPQDNPLYGYYGTYYGIIALWGGICGIAIARHWGGMKSVMGKAIIMLALGLFAQEFGQIAYTYYIFVLNIEIPYPSIGDLGFFGTIPFYIYAAYLIGKASGVKFSLRSYMNRVQAVLIPLVVLGFAYFTILINYPIDLSVPLETFLNFGYPAGQAIYISIAVLAYTLTRNILGGVMKPVILFIIFAFGSQFLADYLFIYFHDAYYPGSILDYMYALAYFLMGWGVLQLQTVLDKLRSTN